MSFIILPAPPPPAVIKEDPWVLSSFGGLASVALSGVATAVAPFSTWASGRTSANVTLNAASWSIAIGTYEIELSGAYSNGAVGDHMNLTCAITGAGNTVDGPNTSSSKNLCNGIFMLSLALQTHFAGMFTLQFVAPGTAVINASTSGIAANCEITQCRIGRVA